MLRPGRIKFSDDPTSFIQKSLAKFGYATNTTNDAGRTTPDGTFSDEYGVSAADKKSIEDAIGSKQYGTVHNFDIENNSGSIRYFEFSSTAAIQREYMAVLSTLSSRLYSRMSGTAMTWANVIGDAGVLRLIRAYLNSGIMQNGVVVSRYQGTPQGGPLSPLLANVLLDEVDKELERRSTPASPMRFCRRPNRMS
jgi:hypothetical protein